MNYKILSDSSSNVRALEKVEFASVPLKIICGEHEFVDDENLDVPEMLSILKASKERSSTSCPNTFDWLDNCENADCIFSVALTSTLSGGYASAVQAKKILVEEHPEKKFYAIDTLSTGPENRLIVEKLESLIISGNDFETICSEIDKYKEKTHLVFSLQSLDNFAKNGRISPAVAKLAGLLGICIVGRASSEGTLEPLHKVRGKIKALNTIYKAMTDEGFKGGKVRIAHCYNPEDANSLKEIITKDYPDCDISIELCGGLCNYYAEDQGILVGFES